LIHTVELHFSTRGSNDVLDITSEVQDSLRETGLANGVLTLFSPSSTSALTTIEYEPGCVTDISELFEKIIPENKNYKHNARWGDGNGHSHLRAALLGPSLNVPFIGGKLTLGTWQQIVFIDFDNRPRNRRLVLQVIGE
jgi:secondary thiamine-phosphate synthase enzyme